MTTLRADGRGERRRPALPDGQRRARGCLRPASSRRSSSWRRRSPAIEDVDPVVNALPIRFFDEALAAARAGRGALRRPARRPAPARGPPGRRQGRGRGGRPALHRRLARLQGRRSPSVTAASVQRIIDAGGIIHARSATPEFCCAAITESRLWGVTRNPWNPAYSPGGSSGGSGAALAAGMATLATGSDIGGSIRIPASFCGVVGFKPPYGRVPQMPPFNLDHYCHEGPMARTVEDCRLLENVMAGPHPEDIVSLRPKLTIPAPSCSRVRAGRSPAASTSVASTSATRSSPPCAAAAETFRALGATVDEVDARAGRSTTCARPPAPTWRPSSAAGSWR